MEERIIKKTLELIFKDVKSITKPVISFIEGLGKFILILIKSGYKSVISAGAILLLNKKGVDIYNYFHDNASFEEESGIWILNKVFLGVFGAMLIIKLIANPSIMIKFLLITHSIGLIFLFKDYLKRKKEQATQELDEKNIQKNILSTKQKGGINK